MEIKAECPPLVPGPPTSQLLPHPLPDVCSSLWAATSTFLAFVNHLSSRQFSPCANSFPGCLQSASFQSIKWLVQFCFKLNSSDSDWKWIHSKEKRSIIFLNLPEMTYIPYIHSFLLEIQTVKNKRKFLMSCFSVRLCWLHKLLLSQSTTLARLCFLPINEN